jgi:hypothetical protein
MTDIGVLLRTYLEPFQWLGLGSGGAIPLWNASRLVRSYRRREIELEDFFASEAVFEAFFVICAGFSHRENANQRRARRGYVADTTPARPPFTRHTRTERRAYLR